MQGGSQLGVGRWLVPSLRHSVLALLSCASGCFPRAEQHGFSFLVVCEYCSAKKIGLYCLHLPCTCENVFPRSERRRELIFSDTDLIFTGCMRGAMLTHDHTQKNAVEEHFESGNCIKLYLPHHLRFFCGSVYYHQMGPCWITAFAASFDTGDPGD